MLPLNKRNVFNGLVIGLVPAIVYVCKELAPRYPVPCTAVLIVVSAVATALRLPVSGNPTPPPEGGNP